ncbi:hypothetical protein FOMPIDRAFT_85854 [Fomitopsis schrenkii]|uniref:DUF6534 domain-containing protein n=1 Tax=Fomitopsis schrenkii TaxID=2126942 RepID=S8F2G7_FOMSC|nr:hypothetical protein FOMPIDRAFT_85854 [Fomitopsis schrenkii]
MSDAPTELGAPDAGASGPILLQALSQYFLQGVVLSQGAKFWGTQRSRNDSKVLCVYVATLVLLSLLQTILETYKVWHEVIFKRHWYMSRLHWTEFLANGLICTFCEVFLIRRCWKFTTRNYWILAPLATLSFSLLVAYVYLVGSIAMAHAFDPEPVLQAVRIEKVINAVTGYADPLKAGYWAFPFWVFGSLVLSITLTGILSWYLYKSKIGIVQTDQLVQTIINVTWETAALPTVSIVVAAAFYCSKELTSVRHLDLFFSLLTGKLYTLGVLRTLNLRTRFRASMVGHDLGGRQSLSDFDWNSASTRVGSLDQTVSASLLQIGSTIKSRHF